MVGLIVGGGLGGGGIEEGRGDLGFVLEEDGAPVGGVGQSAGYFSSNVTEMRMRGEVLFGGWRPDWSFWI